MTSKTLSYVCMAVALALTACAGETEQGLLNSAKTFIDKKDQRSAVIQLKTALQKFPNSGEGRLLLGQAENIRAGREPFPRIMEAVGRLRDDEQLRVLAPFEPRPLIGVLVAQGFVAKVTQTPDGGFEVLFATPAPHEPDDDSLL